jgi:hypothetical protein
MDFDIAGLLSNPDVLYMMAGLGGAIGKDNPFAVAAGNMTQQGIAAQNQKKLLTALLGQGGAPKAEGTTEGLGGWDQFAKELGLPPGFINKEGTKFSTDGKNMNISMPSPSGQSGTPSLNMASATPSSGGQQDIINPSSGLLGDLSGLSLAGLKPEDINKAITLGLTGADLERKKVSDLLQGRYRDALIAEREAARGAKDTLAPVDVPGLGRLPSRDWEKLPTKTKAYAYAMTLRRQNGQSIISPEQFEREINPSEMEKLIELSKKPGVLDKIKEIYGAKAPQINLGELGARQEQHEIIKNWADIGTPKHRASLTPTKEERRSIVKQVETKAVGKNNDEYEKMLGNALEEHKLRRFQQDAIGAKGKKVSGPKWDAKRNVYVWKFINPLGKEEEVTLEK